MGKTSTSASARNRRRPGATATPAAEAATDTKGTDPNPPAAGAASPATDAGKGKGTETTTEEPVVVPEPKCAEARIQRGRPHPNLLQVISKKNKHPGKGHRIRRWDRYSVGMSVLHCRVTYGLDHLDIGYYVRNGLMELRPMTDVERKEALARWDGEATEAQPAVAAA